MTTKVLLVNFGPDVVVVRAVAYSYEAKTAGVPPQVLNDADVTPGTSKEFWVHSHQQLLVGEVKPSNAPTFVVDKP